MKTQLPRFRRLLRSQAFTNWGRLCTLLFISISLSNLASAQSKIWDKTIGGADNDILTSVQLTHDGGYLLGGTSDSGKSGDKTQDSRDEFYGQYYQGDYWVVKLNPDGTKAWDKRYGGSSQDILAAIVQTSDGGYILAGTSNSYKSGDKSQDPYESEEFGFNNDYWIVRLRADGSKIWDRTIGGNEDEELVSVQQTKDGGFILGGYSPSNISGDKSQASKGDVDYWIVKLNADGSKAWDKTIGGKRQDFLQALQQTSDGGFILGGFSASDISGDKTEGRQDVGDDPYSPTFDYWVVKLNADGTKAWDKTIGGNKDDRLRTLQQTSDDGYILGGSSDSDSSGDKTEAKKDTTKDYSIGDYWVVKLNASGKKVWDRTIGGTAWDDMKSVQQTKDGGYILGGSSYSGKGGDKTENRKNGYWIVKLNSEGVKTWDKTISSQGGDKLSSVQQTPDGNYLLGGSSAGRISGDKTEDNRDKLFYNRVTTDFWIVKVDNLIRQNQDITFTEIPTKTTTDPAFTLSAIASSGLPVTFEVISGPATVNKNKLTLTGAGEVIVKAIQTGNATYNPAVATQAFTVTLASKQQDITYGGNRADTLTTMLATPDGGYLLAGTSASGIFGDKTQASPDTTDFWLVKTDVTGQKIWDKSFGGNGIDKPTTLVATLDGGYLLGGSSTSGISGQKSQASKGKSDFWIIKLDEQGNKQWDKTYGGSEQDQLTAILVTNDGYLLGGTSASGSSGDKSQASKGDIDFWVVNIDAKGKVRWDKTYGGSKADGLVTMVPTAAGYLLGGTSASGTSGDKSQANRSKADYWIVQINKDGNKQWDNTYGGLPIIDEVWDYTYNLASELRSIVPTPDGGFLLGGSSAAAKGAEKSEERPAAYSNFGRILEFDYWIVKIDAQGKKLWDKIYGGVAGTTEVGFEPTDYGYVGESDLSKIIPLPEGGYLLSGTSNANAGVNKSEEPRRNDEIIYNTPEVNDYWIVKIDEQGTILGDKTIGGFNNDKLATALLSPNGDYILGGTSFSRTGADKSATNKGIADFWVVQVKDASRPTPLAWNLRYGGSGTDNLTSVIKTRDGGYLAGGYTNSGVSGDKSQASQGKNDYWIVKSDKNGKKEWDKRWGGTQDDYLNRVIQTQDGGYLLGGSSFSSKSGDKSEASKGERDYWVVKVDKHGNKQWDKTYGGSGSDELKKVLQLSTGEYVLAGSSNSPVSGDQSQESRGGNDYWFVKISSTGSKIWDKRYGGRQDETLGSFSLTATGGFLLGGTSLSGASGDKTQPSQGGSDFWLVRLDSTGHKIWDKRFGGPGEEVLFSMGVNQFESEQAYYAGDYFAGGYSTSGVGGDKTQASQGGQDFWLVQLHRNGKLVRDLRYGGSKDEELRAVIQTQNGDYLLAGTSYSGQSGDKSQASKGESDYWLLRIDAFGNKYYDLSYGGSGREELRYLQRTTDGSFVLGGRSDSGVSGDRTQPSQGGPDYWLVKVAPETTPIVAIRTITPVEESKPALSPLTAYPNPFTERVTIHFTLPETQATTVKVYDGQGQEITTLFQQEAQANQTYQVEWHATQQAAGIYLLQLQTPTKRQQQKLLLTK